jgi:hypothetical protein
MKTIPFVFLLTLMAIGVNVRAQLPYFESFTGTTAQGVNLYEEAVLLNGVLRLSSASGTGSRGYAVGEQIILPAGGLEIEFEYFAYGGSGDGMSFFLFDGNTPSDPANGFQIGGNGGSLGYAQRSGGVTGVSNAYLGIGIDPFGNFSMPNEGRQGGPGRRAGSITLRGAGNGDQRIANNYPFLVTNTPSIPLHFSGDANRTEDTLSPKYRKCVIKLKPRVGSGFNIDVLILQGDSSGNFIEHKVIDDFAYTTPSPPSLKYGFAATTGGTKMNFEVRNFSVNPFVQNIPPPQPEDISVTTCENVAVNLDIGAYTKLFGCPLNCFNVSSFDLNPADPSSTSQNVTRAAGVYDYNPNSGILTFTPDTNFTGSDSIQFTFRDAFGNLSSTGKIRINVVVGNCVDLELNTSINNSKPTVGTNVEFTFAVINNGGNQANNIQVPVNPSPAYSGISVVSTTHGTFDINSNIWSISSLNVSDTAVLILQAQVLKSNDPKSFRSVVSSSDIDPVPLNDSADIVSIPLPIIRADASAAFVNETISGDLSINDAYNSKPTYSNIVANNNNPSGATISLQSNGIYSFSATEQGRYSFVYQACEGSDCWLDSLFIYVTNPLITSGNPIVSFPDFAVMQGAKNSPFSRFIDVAVNDLSANFLDTINAQSCSIVSGPSKGSASVQGGRIFYTPDDDTYGFDFIKYEICDNQSNCGYGYVYIHILEVGDVSLTVASDNIYRTQQGKVLTINTELGLRNNDMSFPFFVPFTQIVSSPTGNGNSIIILNNGSVTFTPNSSFNGTSKFVYESCSNQECAKATGRVMAAPGYYWTGSVSSVWNDSANWVPSVPSSSDVAAIPEVDTNTNHYPSLSGNQFDIASIVLSANSQLRIQNNAGLQVAENITNDGLIILEADQNGYGQLRFLVNYRGNGSVRQKMFIQNEGWRNISPPFANLNAGVFGQIGTDRHPNAQNLFGWNTGSYNYQNVPNNNESLIHGKGYFGYFGTNGVQTGTGPWTLEIEGSPQRNVTYVNALQHTVADSVPGAWDDFVPGRGDDGWVLVGNPFTCSFNFGGLNATSSNSAINNAFYIWNPAKNNPGDDRYEYYSGGGISDPFIAPMQSFWVQTKPTLTGTENFSVNMASHGSIRLGAGRPTFFRPEANDFDRIVLRTIEYGDSSAFDYTVVAFIDSTTDGYDPDWDAHKMFNGLHHPNIYSRDSTGYYLAVNAIDYDANRSYSRTLPISFNASKHLSAYSIYLDDSYMFNNYSVYLEDLKTNQFHNLSNGLAYTFAYDSLFEHRFVLHFQSLSFNVEHDLPNSNANIKAWLYNDVLHIRSDENVTTEIEIIAANGQSVFKSKEINHRDIEVNLPKLKSGLYIIKLRQSKRHLVLKYLNTDN